MLGVFHYLLRQMLSEPRTYQLAGLAAQHAPETRLSPWPSHHARVPDLSDHTQLFCRCWDPNSGAYACGAGTLLPEQLPQALLYHLAFKVPSRSFPVL